MNNGSFLVPLVGGRYGRWYIITQLAIYTTYIPLIVLANWVIIYQLCFSWELTMTKYDYDQLLPINWWRISAIACTQPLHLLNKVVGQKSQHYSYQMVVVHGDESHGRK